MDDQQLGELIGTVRAIKENTDRIPQLAIALAVHERRITDMEPLVASHEKTSQRAFGVAMVGGLIAGSISYVLRSIGH